MMLLGLWLFNGITFHYDNRDLVIYPFGDRDSIDSMVEVIPFLLYYGKNNCEIHIPDDIFNPRGFKEDIFT